MNLIFFASSTLSLRFASCARPRLSLSMARFSPRRAAGKRRAAAGAARYRRRSAAWLGMLSAVAGDATRGTAAGGRRVRRVWRGREDLAPKPRGRTASVDSVGDSKPSHTTHDQLSASRRSTSRCHRLVRVRRRHHAVRSEITSLIAKNWI